MPRDPSRCAPLRRRGLAALGLAALGTGAFLPAVLSAGAAASPVGSLQARAEAIAAQITATNTKLSVLSEEYDQAKLRVASLDRQIEADKGALSATRHDIRQASHQLEHAAVAAYVSAGSSSGMSVLMSSSESSLPLQQTYMQAASDSIATEATVLSDSEHQLSIRRLALSSAQANATSAEATIAAAQHRADQLVAQLRSTEASVKGQLAAAVARQTAIEQQQAAARDAAQRAAAATVRGAAAQPPPVSAPAQPTSTPTLATPTGGGAGGAAAVKAAESQIGVPYVWGGATPGVGFDCSGLAMWAWAQAGVNLPHSAQAQYDSIEHVSMSDLQPGDLIFYASGGYIYHVIMYIGGGQAVQAEDTGTTIQITPVWGGAYGAGRP